MAEHLKNLIVEPGVSSDEVKNCLRDIDFLVPGESSEIKTKEPFSLQEQEVISKYSRFLQMRGSEILEVNVLHRTRLELLTREALKYILSAESLEREKEVLIEGLKTEPFTLVGRFNWDLKVIGLEEKIDVIKKAMQGLKESVDRIIFHLPGNDRKHENLNQLLRETQASIILWWCAGM